MSAVIEAQSPVPRPYRLSVVVVESPSRRRIGPRWMRMASDPSLVSQARKYAAEVLAQAGVGDERLVEDIRLLVSELVTNAMRATERFAHTRGVPWEPYEQPVALRVEYRPAWVHLLVLDPDPRMTEPKPRDVLDEGGRGTTIIDAVGALAWHVPGTYGKAVHVVATRAGVELTELEISQLRRRVIL